MEEFTQIMRFKDMASDKFFEILNSLKVIFKNT